MEAAAPTSLEFLPPCPSEEAALAALAAPVRAWFVSRFGRPTAGQRAAWPAVAAGKRLLLSAPTGTGKTLAAFLPVLGELLTQPPAASVRCLYLTPLKALGNDIRKTLRSTLTGIAGHLAGGSPLPRVVLRTGDTPAPARKRIWADPPEILLTTPESLAVMLSQDGAADLFGGLRRVIVDEVHALVANKRGADLSLSLERLEVMRNAECGVRNQELFRTPHSAFRTGLQRIGLSATAAPLTEVAQFLAGAERACAVAQVEDGTPLELTLRPLPEASGFFGELIEQIAPEVERHRSVLVFTNTRALAERLSWALRRRFPLWDEQIAVHHSSLAAVRRRHVERDFKKGKLRAVISSTSLELGIDIGTVDLVILVHPPGDVIRLLQRVGRAGHGPGRVRRGLVLTATTAELLEAAVTAASARSGQCEPLRVAEHPLDVLCQQLLGMAAARAWLPDEAYELVRRAYPYHRLPRRDFDDCLDYLSGGPSGPDGEAWLPARLRWEDDLFTLRDERTARLLRRNLGTILTEEPCPVVVDRGSWIVDREEDGERSTILIGSVDEAFAERLQPGDRFLLDGRCLEFRRLERPRAGELAVVVEEVTGRPRVPAWGGEGWPLSPELARRLYLFRVRAAEALRDGPRSLAALLREEYGLERAAVEGLGEYFTHQETLSEIPDTKVCLVEAVRARFGADYYLHTPLNRTANDALARVAALRLMRESERRRAVVSVVADLGFALLVRDRDDLTPDDFRRLLSVEQFDDDLRAALSAGFVLRERFRRVAFTGLMLLRNPLGTKRKVGGRGWGEGRLFDQVAERRPDFVLLRQSEREVREHVCDAAAARAYLEGLPRLPLRCRWLASPGPFVEGWTQSETGVTEPAETPDEALRRLHAALTNPIRNDE